MMHRATLGLGGNIGDPVRSMARALQRLDQREDCAVVAVSRVFRTPPWGKTDQADFFNACAAVDTCLKPVALLDVCLELEREMKRERIERWGPRTLDIDVLTYDDLVQTAPKLELPHPRMLQRGFVLMPLSDFAAGMPIGDKTVADWLKDADVTGIEVAGEGRDWWRS